MRSKNLAVLAALLFSLTVGSSAVASSGAPTAHSTRPHALIPSVGTRITGSLPAAGSRGPGSVASSARSWLPLNAAAYGAAKLAAATAAAHRANDFSISASPSSRSVVQGTGTTYLVSTTVTSGKPQTVGLSVSGLPSGATGSFSPASILAGKSSTLTIATSGSAATGTVTLTIKGTGTSVSHTTTVSLTITASPPPNDFSISGTPATQTVVQGAATSFTVTTVVTSGSAQTISLSISGLPSGVTGTFSPPSISAGGSSTLNLTASLSAATGSFTITVTGTGTSATHSSGLGLVVTASSSSGPTIGSTWLGETQAGLAPPDPTGAIGPNSYIELINERYGIFGRDGSLIDHGDLGALTGFPTSELTDSTIVWDPTAQHFYYLSLDFATSAFAFGYSTTADPRSSADFCKYIVNAFYSSSYLPDYPKLAVTQDFVLIGTNVFLAGSFYTGSDVDWFQKPTASTCPGSLGTGNIFSDLKNADGSQTSTPEPAIAADAASGGWVVGSADVGTGSASFLTVFHVTKAGSGAATISAPSAVPVASYSVPANAPELGASQLQDTLDSRLTHAVAGYDPRLGATAIWTAHAVFGGAGSEDRWYEINTVPTPSLAQAGKVTDPNLYVWNGALSPDRAADDLVGPGAVTGSDMVMGFNTSSSTTDPALQMVSQRGVGAQSAFVLVHQSPGPNVDFSCTGGSTGNVCRWGDYGGATPDPLVASGGRDWLSGEWNLSETDGSQTVWQTWNWSATP